MNRFGRTSSSCQPEPQIIRPPRTELGNQLREIFSPDKLDFNVDFAEIETKIMEKARLTAKLEESYGKR